MTKPLNLTEQDRIGCKITFNVNRFEVYHANGWLMTAASSKTSLKEQLVQNKIKNAVFDGIATRKYIAG
jgi:hypothetical protein